MTHERVSSSAERCELPLTVICPVFNEAANIDEVVDRLRRQTHTNWRVVFADGRSTDDTKARLNKLAAQDERILVIDNPKRLQSAGLNAALPHCDTDLIVRIDGHSFLEPDYLERIAGLMLDVDAAVVGGRMVPRPAAGRVAKGIALANQASWGAGPGRFHHDGEPGPVDTVYLGSFQRAWLDKVGGWAEDVGVNEDYELNYRIRKAGGTVWLDPSVEVGYEPRTSLAAVARQYYRYGKSKLAVMRRHPGSARPRQLAPAAAPVVLLATTVIGWPLAAWRLPLALCGWHYALLLGLAGRTSRRLAVPAASAAWLMHWTWAAGFWSAIVRPIPPAAAPIGTEASSHSTATPEVPA